MLKKVQVLVILAVILSSVPGQAIEIQPFRTSNRSPLVQIYGLPAAERSALLAGGQWEGTLSYDLASNYTRHASGTESIILDGETSRLNLALRHGLSVGWEIGVDIPMLWHRGSFLDAFIEDWHSFFSLPQGGRDHAPHDRLAYHYERSSRTALNLTDATEGLGDVSFSLGRQLVSQNSGRDSVALRVTLKLPTGESDRLLGSGSTDLALSLSAATQRPGPGGDWALWGNIGLLAMSDGDVLQNQQRNLAAFGTGGLGWAPADWIAFKVQVDGHTPFYDDSDLDEVSTPAAQLTLGGSLSLSPHTQLDLGVTEDIVVATAPDVVFHLALRHRF